ncbi:thymidine kinase [Aerococcus suis]|uniref:Thymidine kinase n=1 Tax=Aerococcus suis TaxID=371602 RepID=A0A1W1YDU0_9LACT|nr:thymidine kinase [Aerococcus suis]MCI7240173.1 thymidine kinase [Aerococcus suis]MDD7758741.1 thymidine kinase [Aerococcus suis]MDY4646902.1 thymidine kinase [Aerococcus suis]SMC34315.1 thymidine kinase [Aerococcus suis]
MAQLFFRYGAMNSGKSFEIIKVAHNYEEQNKDVLVLTSATDDRDGVGNVTSRVGERRDAIPIDEEMNIYDLVAGVKKRLYCVLVDEAQFLKRHHIYQLAQVVDELNIPVMAFGLKNDFQNHLFEGSKYLLLLADKIEEVKTICWFCDKKAIMNLRVHEGQPVYDGEQIQVGGNEAYFPVCRKHYHHPPLKDNQIYIDR